MDCMIDPGRRLDQPDSASRSSKPCSVVGCNGGRKLGLEWSFSQVLREARAGRLQRERRSPIATQTHDPEIILSE